MANPKLPNLSEAEQSLLYEKLNAYNRDKASFKEAGCYLVVLPWEGHANCSLWFYAPLLERRSILFIEELKPDIVASLRIVTSLLWHANRCILITEYNEKRMAHNGDDLVPFGKYRGHFLHEVLSIDPSYISWIAFKFEARIPKQERFVIMAKAYYTVYLDKSLKKNRQSQSASHYLGKKGDKLSDITVKITKVRLEDDPYKTRFADTTPLFYVRQRLTAIDTEGNFIQITASAVHPSRTSGQLSSLEYAYKPGEVLHIASARITGTYDSHGIQYTRIAYIKFNKNDYLCKDKI